MTATDMVGYYARRATEYEAIYHKPERQEDLARLRAVLPPLFAGEHVLEVACGTGWWTEVIAPGSASVLATDRNPEVLAVARAKRVPPGRVRFREADAYDLAPLGDGFTAALAAFWWSHVPLAELPGFLDGLHARLRPGARVVFIDNGYVEGSSTQVSETDAEGNTYQLRRLADGSEHRVLKNFPGDHALRAAAPADATEVEVERMRYYWVLSYRLPAG